MNIHFVSHHLFVRHAELVSASHSFNSQQIMSQTLKQVQGDDHILMYNKHSKTRYHNRTKIK